jgi:hypothetical protein
MNVLNVFKYYAPKHKDKDNLSFYSKRSIYFQKPTEFNDPWDCKAPEIKIPRHINSLKDIWFNLTKHQSRAFAEKGWQNIREKFTRNQTKQLFYKHFNEVFEKPRSKIGIFSLSFIPDCELMWSHYASSHTGYMLHFQIDPNQYFSDSSLKDVGIPTPVLYREKREIWKIENYFADKIRHFNDLIRFKSKAWEYECELRLLNVDKYGFIKTPSNWLKSIVIGIDTDSKLQDKLKDIGNALNIPVLSSKMNEKEYKIDIPGLEINGNDGRTSYKKEINSRKYEL